MVDDRESIFKNTNTPNNAPKTNKNPTFKPLILSKNEQQNKSKFSNEPSEYAIFKALRSKLKKLLFLKNVKPHYSKSIQHRDLKFCTQYRIFVWLLDNVFMVLNRHRCMSNRQFYFFTWQLNISETKQDRDVRPAPNCFL